MTFADQRGLKKEGQTLFSLEDEQKEIEDSQSKIRQGSLELSNVNTMEEMIRVIDSLRSFESCNKIVQVEDELNGRAVNDLAKV